MDNTAFQPLFLLAHYSQWLTLAHNIPLGLPLGQAQDSDITNLVAIGQVQLSQTWSRWAVNQMPDSKIRNPSNETTKYIYTYVCTYTSTKYNGCTANEACKGGPKYILYVYMYVFVLLPVHSQLLVLGALAGKENIRPTCMFVPPLQKQNVTRTECLVKTLQLFRVIAQFYIYLIKEWGFKVCYTYVCTYVCHISQNVNGITELV